MINNTNFQDPTITGIDVGPQAPINPPAPTAINPRIKPSGAPVSFSPKSQNTIMSAFGNPVENSYDRTVSGPVSIPQPIIDNNTPVSNFYNT